MPRKQHNENKMISSNGHMEEYHFPSTNRNSGMPLIRCVCGAAILLIPDIKAMNRAIENHIAEHTRKNKGTEKRKTSTREVRRILVEQILEDASEQRIT